MDRHNDQSNVQRELNKELRQHLKNTAKEAWQLVNWLTHDRSANRTASSIAIHSGQTVIGHFIQVLERQKTIAPISARVRIQERANAFRHFHTARW